MDLDNNNNTPKDLSFAEGAEGMSTAVEYARPMTRRRPVYDMTDDIVISGIAGRFPESDNMDEYANNLFKNIDMVTEDDRRWPTDLNSGIVGRSGKLKDIDKFDSVFFSTFGLLADAMDPQARILLETTYEAICDAGINPQTLRGSRTGVYVGINTVACADGYPQNDFDDCRRKEAALWVYGSSKALYANRISFMFDLHGPSTLIDTACSSSMVALQNAVAEMRTGNCDMAIVGTGNLVQAPFSNHVYTSIGLLASDGKCKVWDKRADGFVRSETVGCLLLQRRSEARRVYATVLHAKTNTDGFKSIGLFSPFWLRQRDLMIETYEEAGIDPNEIKFFESHGTGTNVGDPQEAKAIADAYCKERKEPLLLGAVKSNLGHSEGSSGLNSIGKVIVMFENKCIPANLHFQEAKPEIEVIVNKQLAPVLKNTPFDGGIVGVNSFGVGGVNAHALLKSWDKDPKPDANRIVDNIPRLINVCGRTQEAVNHIFDFIEKNPEKVNKDFLALIGEPMKSQAPKGSAGFPYRGFMVVKEETKDDGTKHLQYNRTINSAGRGTQIWLCFSGMGSQWTGMAKALMAIPTFADSLKSCAEALKPLNFDLMYLLLSDDKEELKRNVTNAFVAITAMQIALYDLLCLLDVQYEGLIGHSFGEVGCAYADGCLTREQAILTAYWRGKIVETAKLPKGMLAAVGLSWEETIRRCPDGIVAACHNGSDSVTISGLYDNMVKFIDQLKAENIFVRQVTGGDFPYHSPFMNIVAPQLLEALNKIIPKPKLRSEKWVSTSIPEDKQNEITAKFASGEYFTNNLISPVLFNDGMRQVPKYANVIEVAPHSLFESIFKRCFPQLTYSGLMKRTEADNLDYFLASIGRLYCFGLNMSIENMYPKVEFPVSRGTQSLSSLIQWDHSASHEVRKYPEYHNFGTASDYTMKFSITDADWSFLRDHAVDGRILFPATGYLMLAWRRFAALKSQPWKRTPIVFENVRFFRPTLLSEGNEVKFTVKILDGTGDFTISEGNSIAATGRVYSPEEGDFEFQDQLEEVIEEEEDEDELKEILYNKDIYKELRIRGYDYGPKFQGLVEARGDGRRGKAKWTDHWVSFVDSVMHLALIALPIRTLFIPIGFQRIVCDPNVLFAAIEKAKKDKDKEQIIEETKDFFYFNESTRQKYDKELGQYNESKEFSTGELMVNELEFGTNLEEDEKRGTNKVITDNIKATLKSGEESMASEFLGISNFALEKNPDDEGKESIIPVGFDIDYRSIYTKGLEIKGFLPVNVPRRPGQQGLVLEKYQFVSNNEDNAIEPMDKKSLVEYIQVCCALGQRLTEMSPKVNKLKMNGYKMAAEDVIQKYIEKVEKKDEGSNHILLKVINELSALKIDDNSNIIVGKEDNQKVVEFDVAVKEILSKPENDIKLDYINSMVGSERFLRPSLDLILENNFDKNFKILEISPNNHLMAPTVINTLRHSSIAVMHFDYTVANPKPSTLPEDIKTYGLKVLEWDLQNSHNFIKDMSSIDLLVFRTNNSVVNQWSVEDQIKSFSDSMKENGFLLITYRHVLTPPEIATFELLNKQTKDQTLTTAEAELYISFAEKYGFKLVSRKSDSITCSQLLFRKVRQQLKDIEVIHILNDRYEDWLEVVKQKMAENKDEDSAAKNIWLVANDTAINGIIGLANCLRLEGGGQHIRCLFDYDNRLPKAIDFNLTPYRELRQLDLFTNIYRNNEWGTLRHICLPKEQETISTEHAYLNVVTRGDMGSLKWFDAHHKYFPELPEEDKNPKEVLCDVYYSALNFKDVVLVSGKIQPGPESALFDCIIGLEFAGRRTDTGKKVMGMVPFKGIATTLLTHKDYLWEVPDDWTLEDAATVPVVYITAYYALITRGQLKRGESVLIHSGAGGVGQAAIFICQSMGCKVLVTIGNKEKREFIKEKFGIADKYIGNSHETSFEKQFMKVTKGKGVDVVLNSLTEDKLQASVRCLAPNGRFLEIGKYDMQMNKNLGLFAFLNNITFHGVGLDCIFREGPNSRQLKEFMEDMTKLLSDGIKKGVVQPIERTVFQKTEAEDAFRYMTTGKHVGKVLIKIRDEERHKVIINEERPAVEATTRTWFHPSKVYVITGGLGGFGLELAYWMVLRGAKKLVLTSRTGIKNSYQKLYLKRFRKFGKLIEEYKIDITVSTMNATSLEGAHNLIDECNAIAPIGGVFNLAMVLKDALIENQTVDSFQEVCQPKLNGLKHLDEVTRHKCPQIDYFVAFSSLTAGRGNGGQCNYGYANSAMERICERRRTDGLPGLAIQWGPIGDVGIVAEHLLSSEDKADVMKLFAGIHLQRISSCLDVMDRFLQTPDAVLSSIVKADNQGSGDKADDEVLGQLCNHLGIDSRPEDSTLGDVGLDSMMAVEIQQRLERDYEIHLALTDIKKITVGELKEFRDGNKDGLKQYSADVKKVRTNLATVRFDMPIEPTSLLNDVKTGKPIFFLPPVEGIFETLRDLAKNFNRPVIALNWIKTMQDLKDIKKVSEFYKDRLKQLMPDGQYDIVGHSFGAIVGIHMCRKSAPIKTLMILDPSDAGIKDDWSADERFEILFVYLRAYMPERILMRIQKEVMEIKGETQRINKLIELLKHYGGKHLVGKDVDEIIKGSFDRAEMIVRYRKKNIAKMQTLKHSQTTKLIQRQIRNIKTDVSVIKLLRKEEEFQRIQDRILSDFGIKREDFEGRFDIHTIVGNESEFLTLHLDKVTDICKQKL